MTKDVETIHVPTPHNLAAKECEGKSLDFGTHRFPNGDERAILLSFQTVGDAIFRVDVTKQPPCRIPDSGEARPQQERLDVLVPAAQFNQAWEDGKESPVAMLAGFEQGKVIESQHWQSTPSTVASG